MSGTRMGAAVALVLALALVLVWGPTAGRRTHAREQQAERALASGEVAVSPAELATLMRSRQVALAIFDLRDEAAYNRFHLVDARRGADEAVVRALPERTVKVLVAADEGAAGDVYRKLVRAGVKQLYVLAGGMPAWLALFAPDGKGALLPGALGDRQPASYPELAHITLPKFEPKVKLGKPAGKKGPGGCGG